MRSIAVPALVLAVPLLLAALAVPPLPAAQESGDELDGKQIFEASRCGTCHSVPTAGIEATTKSEAMKGPDMVDLAEEHEAGTIVDYLRKDATIDDKEHRVAFKGSDEELGALVSWLMDQKTE
ncbi:MAG: c-type cytochrome [bacterium]